MYKDDVISSDFFVGLPYLCQESQ